MDTGAAAVLEVKDLRKWFPLREGFLNSLLGRAEKLSLKAVDGVSFSIQPGEVLGLAGESGCGKSTTGMTVSNLYHATSGQIIFRGQNLSEIRGGAQMKVFRQHAQIVFQNPYESLNPRFTVFRSVEEPTLMAHGGYRHKAERRELVARALERAGLTPVEAFMDRYPHELSGGQLQRVALARAISIEPSFLVADEPVSMLDVSIRAGILNLLRHLAGTMNMGILYISHDLSTMKHICDSVAIMYLGKIVEQGTARQVLERPQHPYARALVAAVPLMGGRLHRQRIVLEGVVPNPIHLPAGCRFHPRCSEATDICLEAEPPLEARDDPRRVACHHC